MKKVLLFVLAITTAVILAACGGGSDSSPNVLKSEDERFQVTTSKEWEDATGMLHPEANLEVYTPKKEKYLMALMEAKEDFVDTTLESYFDIVTDMFQSELEDVKASAVKEVTINGNNALQYELQAVSDGIKIAYLVTIIETPEHFGQVLTWTLGSKWDEYKDELKEVADTFEELK